MAEDELNEKWVQDRISEDPAILGLGDLENAQPGRLDLLQDPKTDHRYGNSTRTDESHIIRTVEYWDIERKRYPRIAPWSLRTSHQRRFTV